MGNNEPAVDQSDLRIRGSYGLNVYILYSNMYIHVYCVYTYHLIVHTYCMYCTVVCTYVCTIL